MEVRTKKLKSLSYIYIYVCVVGKEKRKLFPLKNNKYYVILYYILSFNLILFKKKRGTSKPLGPINKLMNLKQN